jgi:transmembrane protein 231
LVVSLVLAFIIALCTGGLWVKTHTYVTQPAVRFKYDMLLVLETDTPGHEKVWSTFASVNALVGSKLMAVDIQASEQDLNMVGLPHKLNPADPP